MADDDKTGSDGSSGNGTGDAGTNDANNTNQGASGDSGTGDGASGDAGKGDDGTKVDATELEAVKRRMQAADQRASAAEAELKKLQDKDKSELERTQGQVQELTSALEAATKLIDDMALKNAFFTDNKHTWHDPSDALALLDREGVEVKEGNVTGLAPAIEKLAKAKPHLLKTADGDGKNGGAGNGSSGASGSANNGKRAGEGKDDKKDYTSRFPALRGR